MAEELRPCPFCGSTAFMFKIDGSQGLKWGSVVCCDCESTGPMVRTGYDTSDNAEWHADATKEWNTRAEPENQFHPDYDKCHEALREQLVARKADTERIKALEDALREARDTLSELAAELEADEMPGSAQIIRFQVERIDTLLGGE